MLATRLMAGRTRRALRMLSLALLVGLLTEVSAPSAPRTLSSPTMDPLLLSARCAQKEPKHHSLELDLLSAYQSVALLVQKQISQAKPAPSVAVELSSLRATLRAECASSVQLERPPIYKQLNVPLAHLEKQQVALDPLGAFQ